MKRYLVLTGIFLLLGANLAWAQTAPTYQVFTTPTFVIYDGWSEAVGSVRLTAVGASANTFASTIQFNFQNMACDLSWSNATFPIAAVTSAAATNNGPQLIYFNNAGAGGTAVAAAAISSISNTGSGCIVSVTVPGGLTVSSTAPADYIELQGIRGRIGEMPGVGPMTTTQVVSYLTSTPSTSSLFTVPNQGVVAVTNKPIDWVGDTVGSILFCPSPVTQPEIEFTEHFNAAFVQYKDATASGGYALPADHRPLFGAINNSQIHITIYSQAAGASSQSAGLSSLGTVTLAWAAASNTVALTGGGSAKLTLISESPAGDSAVYEYSTTSQAQSDVTLEDFKIDATLALGSAPLAGTAYVQIQMYPPLTSTDLANVGNLAQAPYLLGAGVPSPRFQDPYQPSPDDLLFTVAPCTTNLLWPWVAFVPALGYDTGLAIANTTMDPYGTAAQHGTCTLYGYNTISPPTPASPTAALIYTTPDVPTGGTWANSLSQIGVFNAGTFMGYIIGVCKFQYGHGFGYISDNLTTPAGVTQGYVALIIPDPVIDGGRVANNPVPGSLDNSGEGLSQ